MMPAIATMTANSPSSPKPAASHVVGKIQSRPSAEPGAASCMSVIATMSIAGHDRDPPEREPVPRDDDGRAGEHEDDRRRR